ncbi:hypothetical protein GCM10010372_51180 [Streptomyces tauricus]|nr:hypothetical protein GCM10010372_51180 [Streptomyces tauricus]
MDRLVVLRQVGQPGKLAVTLVQPERVVEVGVDVARDASGRWRHPARRHRIRAELHPMHVPLFGERDDPAGRPGGQYEG